MELKRLRNRVFWGVTLIGLVFTFSTGTAQAAVISYTYDAVLTPTGVNGGGAVPTSATATGTFSYDDASTPNVSGFFDLLSMTFTADATTTTTSPFNCGPDGWAIANCLADTLGNYALFNPTSNEVDFYLSTPTMASWALVYDGTSGSYSQHDAYGAWVITSINQDDQSIPEPATLTLLVIGVAGLGFARRRRNA